MLVIEHDAEQKPGTWKEIKTLAGLTAFIICPKCKRVGVLYDHEIDFDGVVFPSVICAYDDCDFHETIKLNNWKVAK